MKMFSMAVVASAFALGLCGAMPVSAQARSASEEAGDERLRRVLAAVAAQPLTAAPFIERRVSALAATPLESRGTLSFNPAGLIEKQTTSPLRERVTISPETVTIDAGDGKPVTVIKLEAQGALAGYGLGLRALLSGNEKLLRQVFDTRMTGTFENWKVQLLPREPALKRGIRHIMVSGSGARLRLIETSETGGDTIEMTIIPR